MISTLITSINKRLQRYESNDAFKLATVLDPRWKLDWCLADEVEDIKSLVNDKVASVGPVNDATIDRADTPPAPKKNQVVSLYGKKPTSLQSEIDDYLDQPTISDDADPLVYWEQHQQQFPQLTSLAMRYLAIPASSAPVERLFSIAGKVFRADRSRLSDARFEELMFLRCNSHIS